VAALADTILELLARRAPASICPSEVARAVAPADWRPLMPQVRAAAARLASAGRIRVTQGAHEVDAIAARGPIRLRLP
jgi:hypothetical protein